ncbi:MAG: hypothetical protein ABFS32_12355 [Bacteroidota bacterium]
MKKDITYKFDHIGVPTKNKQEGEIYMAEAKCFLTDPAKTKYFIEYLRPEEGCTYSPIVLEKIHISFLVENLDEALEGENVVIEPFLPVPTRRIAFIDVEGCIIELAEKVE